MKLRDASHDITVIERNRADDTFGWGVVLSDETLANLKNNDPVSAEAIQKFFAYWDDIALVHRANGLCRPATGFAASAVENYWASSGTRCRARREAGIRDRNR